MALNQNPGLNHHNPNDFFSPLSPFVNDFSEVTHM